MGIFFKVNSVYPALILAKLALFRKQPVILVWMDIIMILPR